MAQDSVVGTAARYGLDGMGLKPSGGEIFDTRQDWPGVQPASCTMQWVPSPFPGGKISGRDVDHSASSSVSVKERVDLYLYSLLCLRGLF